MTETDQFRSRMERERAGPVMRFLARFGLVGPICLVAAVYMVAKARWVDAMFYGALVVVIAVVRVGARFAREKR